MYQLSIKDMNPLAMMGGDDGINLYSICLNVVFGFVVGLVIYAGFEAVIAYGSKLATAVLKLTGYGQQMAAFGLATSAAPYIVLGPIAALVVKQLTSVRSLKSFVFFAGAMIVGVIAGYVALSLGILVLK